MKRALTLSLMLAVPLFAADAKKQEPAKEQKSADSKPAAAAPAPAPAPAVQDSPFVAAAKRANRLGKKPQSKVITNETLKKSGENAHVTTAERTPTFVMPVEPPPPAPTPEMVAYKAREEKRAADEKAAEEKKKAAEERELRKARSAEAIEEEYSEDVDPAQAEREWKAANEVVEEKPPRG